MRAFRSNLVVFSGRPRAGRGAEQVELGKAVPEYGESRDPLKDK